MASNPIIGPYESLSTPESDTAVARIRCLGKVDSLMVRYREAGRQLRERRAEQAWAEVPALHQDAIDGLGRYRDRLVWFSLHEQARAVALGIGEAAEAVIQVAVDLDSAAGERAIVGATA